MGRNELQEAGWKKMSRTSVFTTTAGIPPWLPRVCTLIGVTIYVLLVTARIDSRMHVETKWNGRAVMTGHLSQDVSI